jgi:hypothetical protein
MNELYPNPSVSDLVQTYTIKAYEDMDNFIFKMIRPYCEDVFEMKLSKERLKRALMEYFVNHPEEREPPKEDE